MKIYPSMCPYVLEEGLTWDPQERHFLKLLLSQHKEKVKVESHLNVPKEKYDKDTLELHR